MVAPLEVWVAEPGKHWLVDERHTWFITVVDARGETVVLNSAAPRAHWSSSTLSPGVYRVMAQRDGEDKLLRSDWAVAQVTCSEKSCAHLFVPDEKTDRRDLRIPAPPRESEDDAEPPVPR